MWSRLAAQYQGIDILPAPESASIRIEIGSEAAAELLSFWRKHYQAVVLDLAGAHAPGFEFAALADQVLLVTTNELAALHATRRTLECLESARVDRSHIRLVVTRYTPATGLKREAVETALKLEPYALLNNDYEGVQAAILDGKPLSPSSPLGRSIHSLAERLLGKEKAARKRLPFFGLLPIRS
jgi:Flp pilus assembly CpaE family ATPase